MPLFDCTFPATQELSSSQLLLRAGPTVLIDVGFDVGFKYGVTIGEPSSTARQIPALIDAGAAESCIDDQFALSIGLPIVDKQWACGIGGSVELSVYLAHIIIPGPRMQWGKFSGVKLKDSNQAHMVLIGRSMLQNMLLIYDGQSGKVTLAI